MFRGLQVCRITM